MKIAAPPGLQNYFSVSRWQREELALLLVLVLAVALRLPWMAQSLWYDEISVTRNYLQNVFHLLDAWAFESNMPVHYTIMFFWDKLFPDTEFSLRFPPLLFGLVAIVISYQIANTIFDRGIALLTCLLLSISPVHIWYSAEARPYAGMMCFLLLAVLAFLKLQEPEALSARARLGWWSLYFLSLLLGTLSQFYMAVPVVVLSGFAILQRKRALTFLAMNSVILLFLACFLWFKYRVAGDIPTGAFYLRPFSLWEAWLLFSNWYPTGNTLARIGRRDTTGWRDLPLVSLCCQLFVSALFVKGLAAALRERDRKRRRWGAMTVSLLFGIPLFLLAINAAGLRASYVERSCYVALPFFLMILAKGVLPAKHTSVSLLLLSGLLLLAGLSTVWFFRYPDSCAVAPCKADWRSAASYLRSDIRNAGPKVAIVGLLTERSLPYYDDRFADRVRLQRLRERLPRLEQMASDIFGEDTAIVDAFKKEMRGIDRELERDNKEKIAVLSLVDVSRARPDSYDALYATETPSSRRGGQRLLQWLRQHNYRLTEEQAFPALHIYKFERHRSG